MNTQNRDGLLVLTWRSQRLEAIIRARKAEIIKILDSADPARDGTGALTLMMIGCRGGFRTESPRRRGLYQMLNLKEPDRLRIVLNRFRRVHAILAECVAEAQQIVGPASNAPPISGKLDNLLGSDARNATHLFAQPIVDMAAMTITWGGKSHRLRNTILLRLLDRLSRRPNHFISYERLLRDAWEGGERSDEAIRNAVHRLKVRLREGGMSDLAALLRTADRRCGLILDAAG